jgi:hypothetical protein
MTKNLYPLFLLAVFLVGCKEDEPGDSKFLITRYIFPR